MSVWVRQKVKECVPCTNKNNPNWPATRAPLIPIKVDPQMWWRVHVDLIGPLPGRKERVNNSGLPVLLQRYLLFAAPGQIEEKELVPYDDESDGGDESQEESDDDDDSDDDNDNDGNNYQMLTRERIMRVSRQSGLALASWNM